MNTKDLLILKLIPIVPFLIFSLILIGFGSCKPDDEIDIIIEEQKAIIDSVYLMPIADSILIIDRTVQLHAIVLDSDSMTVSGDTVSWSTSDSSRLLVSDAGLVSGVGGGWATIFAMAGEKKDSVDIFVIDLTGTWIGGVAPDTVRYIIEQADTLIGGTFRSLFGFPPITNVKEGVLTGYLDFPRYNHTMELTTENQCTMRVIGWHLVQILSDGEVSLKGGSGQISSPDCSIFGNIDHATLRRE